MPFKHTSKRDSSKAVKLQEQLRQFIIKKTKIEDPSPAFVKEYLSGLQSGQSVTAFQNDGARGGKLAGLGIDTAAAQKYTLESLNKLDLDDPLVKHIVQEVLGIVNASPSQIRDTVNDRSSFVGLAKRFGAPSAEEPYCDFKIYKDDFTYICACEFNGMDMAHCPHIEGEVTALQHDEGVNDLAAGALPPHPVSRASIFPVIVVPISPPDAVACRGMPCRFGSRSPSTSLMGS